jgi:hypothetical protein
MIAVQQGKARRDLDYISVALSPLHALVCPMYSALRPFWAKIRDVGEKLMLTFREVNFSQSLLRRRFSRARTVVVLLAPKINIVPYQVAVLSTVHLKRHPSLPEMAT